MSYIASRVNWLQSIIAIVVLAWTASTGAVEFNFIVAPDTPQIAIDGFVAAGERWSELLTDDITVNISIAFGDIPSATGATILGATGSSIFIPPPGTTVVPDFLKLKGTLEADARSVNDLVAVANLPAGTNSLSSLTNSRDGSVILDDDGSGNNTFFRVNSANAKALGLLAPDAPEEDASISFNSGVNFDFDPSDGINSGATDFVGVATHEIGHALGFTSGVDLVDVFTGSGPSANVDLNGSAIGIGTLEPFALFGTMDLFRRSEQSLNSGVDVFDLSTTPGAFFSINGEPSNLALETGTFNGSNQQASHFLDNMGLGIFDPTAGPGELLEITVNDLLVLDVIGYDVISFGTSNGFHNNLNVVDVDGNGSVTPIDALLVVNELNDRQFSSPSGEINLASSVAVFVDVNDDLFVSPIDALLVINALSGSNVPLAAQGISDVFSVPETIPSHLIWLMAFAIALKKRRSAES